MLNDGETRQYTPSAGDYHRVRELTGGVRATGIWLQQRSDTPNTVAWVDMSTICVYRVV